MQVILLEKVQNLGSLGDTVVVAPGFARNYLVPAGKAVSATLDRLLHYTDFHFKTEERMMVEHGYPMSSAHTAEHYVLIERSKLLQHRLQGGDQQVAVDTLDFLKRWLVNHIQKVDRDLAEYLMSRGVN